MIPLYDPETPYRGCDPELMDDDGQDWSPMPLHVKIAFWLLGSAGVVAAGFLVVMGVLWALARKWGMLAILGAVLMMSGCKPKPQPVALHPAGSDAAKGDCHPTAEVAAKAAYESPEEIEAKKPHVSYPECPDNMRLVFPSKRQMKRLYPYTYTDRQWDMEDSDDVEYQHSTCIPDGL